MVEGRRRASGASCWFRFCVLVFLFAGACRGVEIKVAAWVETENLPAAPSRADFHAFLNDTPVKVTSAVTPADSLILLVVMDTVGDLNRIGAAREALTNAIGRLKANEFVALLEAEEGLEVVLDPTGDHDLLQRTISQLRAARYPGLLNTVGEASALADKMLAGSEVRVAVLYITDGSIYQYREDYTRPVINPSDRTDLSRRFRGRLIEEKIARIEGALSRANAPLFFLHLEERTDGLNTIYQNGLDRFARTTGGEALFCSDVAEVPILVERAVRRAADSYVLTLETPQGEHGRARLRIDAGADLRVAHRDRIEITREKE